MSKQPNHNAGHGKLLFTILVIALLPACTTENKADSATQVVAKVNDEEISVHQLNQMLSRSGVSEQAEIKELSKHLLKQLVDQSLMVQQAKSQKLDRDPGILLALENAKRQVLANAWLERSIQEIDKPSVQELSAFYEDHPELFEHHKIYQLKELLIEQTPDNKQSLNQLLQTSTTVDELAANLEKEKIAFKLNQTVQPAEKLPMEHLAELSTLDDGKFISFPKENKLLVMGVLSAKEEPIDEMKALRFIEAYLINAQKKEQAEQALNKLRTTASIEYLGEFSTAMQPSAALTKQAATQPEKVKSESAVEDVIAKGVTGLK